MIEKSIISNPFGVEPAVGVGFHGHPAARCAVQEAANLVSSKYTENGHEPSLPFATHSFPGPRRSFTSRSVEAS